MTATSDPSMKPPFIERLRREHRDLEGHLAALLDRPDDGGAVGALAAAWRRHNALESEAVTAALLQAAPDAAAAETAPLAAARLLQDVVTLVLADLDHGDAATRLGRRQALAQLVTFLLQQEEAPGAGLHARLAASGVADLDQRLDRRAAELADEAIDAGTPSLHLLSLTAFRHPEPATSETATMARQSNMRERDENGRFVSDDDDRRSSRSSARSDDDDRRRDDRGRFMSDDDRGMSRSRARDDDDDGRGWHGDSRGHAEAARRGWESRRDDDDRRVSRGSAGSDDDDRRMSRSSARSDDDDDRRRDDHGRFMSDDDRRTSRSRSDDDDDRRVSRSRARDDDDEGRGWHGDPRGHAEAARRGWESRR